MLLLFFIERYQQDKKRATQSRKRQKAACKSQLAARPPDSWLQGPSAPPPYVQRFHSESYVQRFHSESYVQRYHSEPYVQRYHSEPYVQRYHSNSFIPKEEQRKVQQAFPVFEGAEEGRVHAPGLIVHPGVVDQDYKGELQVLSSCPQGVFSISQGDRIAQLIILPSLHGCFSSSCVPRATRVIGSTGNDSAYLIMPLDSRPSLELVIEGKQFKGILDTGADKSIISSHWWPKTWPVTHHTLYKG